MSEIVDILLMEMINDEIKWFMNTKKQVKSNIKIERQISQDSFQSGEVAIRGIDTSQQAVEE